MQCVLLGLNQNTKRLCELTSSMETKGDTLSCLPVEVRKSHSSLSAVLLEIHRPQGWSLCWWPVQSLPLLKEEKKAPPPHHGPVVSPCQNVPSGLNCLLLWFKFRKEKRDGQSNKVSNTGSSWQVFRSLGLPLITSAKTEGRCPSSHFQNGVSQPESRALLWLLIYRNKARFPVSNKLF